MKTPPGRPFTFKYSQPEEYRFSMDSLELAEIVSEELKDSDLSSAQVLDLCSGCGVIGFEFAHHMPAVNNLDFVEVQEIYKEHFASNLKTTENENKNFNFINQNYESLLTDAYAQKYDVILCNPPYFHVGQGKLSDSEFKNRCRFFMDSTAEKLIDVIAHTLKPNGQAYVLCRGLDDHDMDFLMDLRVFSRGRLSIENLCMIRTAFCLRMQLRESSQD